MLRAQFVHLTLAGEFSREAGRWPREDEFSLERGRVRVNEDAARVVDRDQDRASDPLRQLAQRIEDLLVARVFPNRDPSASVARHRGGRPSLAGDAIDRDAHTTAAARDAQRTMVQ